MVASRQRKAAWILFALGMLLVLLVAWYRDSASAVHLAGLITVAGALIITGTVWREHRYIVEEEVDERAAQIRFRAGWYAFMITMGVVWVAGALVVFVDLPPAGTHWGVLVLIVGIYHGISWWLKRRM